MTSLTRGLHTRLGLTSMELESQAAVFVPTRLIPGIHRPRQLTAAVEVVVQQVALCTHTCSNAAQGVTPCAASRACLTPNQLTSDRGVVFTISVD